jgi:hypothetical protein
LWSNDAKFGVPEGNCEESASIAAFFLRFHWSVKWGGERLSFETIALAINNCGKVRSDMTRRYVDNLFVVVRLKIRWEQGTQ